MWISTSMDTVQQRQAQRFPLYTTAKLCFQMHMEVQISSMTSLILPPPNFTLLPLPSKFTAFSILLLQERGKLRLHDDIRQYLPEVTKFGYKITLRHLASHSSGLRDQWNSLIVAGVRPDDVIDMTMCLHLSANRKN